MYYFRIRSTNNNVNVKCCIQYKWCVKSCTDMNRPLMTPCPGGPLKMPVFCGTEWTTVRPRILFPIRRSERLAAKKGIFGMYLSYILGF